MDEREDGPAVSVALCTFNGARFVAEQLRSILTQSRPVTELVVADDASTDDTVAVVTATLDEFRAGHALGGPRIVLLTGSPQLGVVANFERAMRACTGDLIALSDQDDVWHPDRLARLLAALDQTGAPLAHSDATLVDAGGAPLGPSLFSTVGLGPRELARIAEGRAYELLLRRNHVTGATVLLRTTLRDLALPVPAGWIHDEWLAIVAAATQRTAAVDAPLLDYRQHGGNQIGASALTTSDRVGRLREPRGPRNARLLLRAESLVARIRDLPVSPDRVSLAQRKLAHERRRSRLPAPRLLRVPTVLATALRGDYRRFGNGAPDVLRDLVQPV